jgi:hypothetical protein
LTDTTFKKVLVTIKIGIMEETVVDNGKFCNFTTNCPPEEKAAEGETCMVVSGTKDFTEMHLIV